MHRILRKKLSFTCVAIFVAVEMLVNRGQDSVSFNGVFKRTKR